MGLTTRLFDAKVYALLTLPYCFSIASSWLGYTNFQALLHNYYFLNIRVGHKSPGMFSIFLHQRWGGDWDNNTRAISAYCIPQLMIPWKLSLTLPAQASPTNPQQACSPGHTVHLLVLVTIWKASSNSSRILAKCVPPSDKWISSQVCLKLSPFCFKFPFFSLLFWELRKSHSRTTKDSFHGSTNPTLKPSLRTETMCCSPVPCGKCDCSCKFPEMTFLWVKRYQ